jgi:hypothetical protein
MKVICHLCGHRWNYTGAAENATCSNCGRKTPTTPPTLLEYHIQHGLKVITYGPGRSYVVVPKGDDLWGNLETVLRCSAADDWTPIEEDEYTLVPTYAYDRVVVAGLRCGLCD